MLKVKFSLLKLFTILWLVCLLIGCQMANLPPTTNLTTPTSAILITIEPTAIPLTNTSTAIPTPTKAIPTLSPEEDTNQLLVLLADNKNPSCLLPCWWGVVPGQTKWGDVKPFLNSFALHIRENDKGALIDLPLPEPYAVPDYIHYVSFNWNEEGVIQGLAVDSMNIMGYDPQTIFSLYGVPDEVWLNSLSSPREGILPFRFMIIYRKKGFSFHYQVNATIKDDLITACFVPNSIEQIRPELFPSGPRIYVWPPDGSKTIEQISGIPKDKYYQLELRTSLTVQTLYDKFMNLEEVPCLDTPAKLW